MTADADYPLRGRCCICDVAEHLDGSPVTWRCSVCRRTVCRDHTLTIPDREPTEYYWSTYCSTGCWTADGRPDE